jgi:hypothetical protein
MYLVYANMNEYIEKDVEKEVAWNELFSAYEKSYPKDILGNYIFKNIFLF